MLRAVGRLHVRSLTAQAQLRVVAPRASCSHECAKSVAWSIGRRYAGEWGLHVRVIWPRLQKTEAAGRLRECRPFKRKTLRKISAPAYPDDPRTAIEIFGGSMLTKTFDAAIADPSMYSDPGAYHDLFALLRKEDPVHWTEIGGFRPFWTVSKYNDILEIEKQGDKFINWPRLSLNSIVDEERVRAGSGRGSTVSLRMLVNMDGAEHRAHRSITQSWFMPTNLRKLEAELANLAKEFVDRMEAVAGSCDFVRDVAVWYPLRVIMTILGVPREDDHRMLAWTKALLSSEDEEMAAGLRGVESRQAAIQEFFRYFGALSANRRKEPKDDLASVIANAKLEGQSISDFEAQSYYLIISTAGHDTTSSSSAGGLLALLQNPCRTGQTQGEPRFASKRYRGDYPLGSPVTHFFRTATEDYVLRGKQIKAGDSSMMCYPSANQGRGNLFPDPYTFKVDRTPNRHIAFGYGPHLLSGTKYRKDGAQGAFQGAVVGASTRSNSPASRRGSRRRSLPASSDCPSVIRRANRLHRSSSVVFASDSVA